MNLPIIIKDNEEGIEYYFRLSEGMVKGKWYYTVKYKAFESSGLVDNYNHTMVAFGGNDLKKVLKETKDFLKQEGYLK